LRWLRLPLALGTRDCLHASCKRAPVKEEAMSDLLHDETPMEFFKEQLGRAMEHQRVSTSAFTEYYLVNLLTTAVKDGLPPSEPGFDETPLALMYIRAVQASRFERARLLRGLGDWALFVSGFFADSVQNRLVDLEYYRALGGFAYARLSRETTPHVLGPDVFGELGERFTQFADLLSEISENTRLTSSQSVLRLYQRWAQTGSPRAAALLAERGIAPIRPSEGPPQ
jgi:hypothetical protein